MRIINFISRVVLWVLLFSGLGASFTSSSSVWASLNLAWAWLAYSALREMNHSRRIDELEDAVARLNKPDHAPLKTAPRLRP